MIGQRLIWAAPIQPSDVERFWARVEPAGDCWIWTGGSNTGGYGNFWFAGTNVNAHRFSLQMALGRPLAAGLVACHTCDVPLCVRPSHLYEGTGVQNEADKAARGRAAIGERHGRARLTVATVIVIRASRLSTRRLARDLGVSQPTIRDVRIRRTWKHVA